MINEERETGAILYSQGKDVVERNVKEIKNVEKREYRHTVVYSPLSHQQTHTQNREIIEVERL